jgi:hypothetical protein
VPANAIAPNDASERAPADDASGQHRRSGGDPFSRPGPCAYLNGGNALHAFDRASYRTPQSVGCVELPEAEAKQIWPYTPVGTPVTIEH